MSRLPIKKKTVGPLKTTPRQQIFVDNYLVTLNATKAAISAGYSPRTADNQAGRLLQKPHIKEAISRAQGQRAQRTQITADRVLTELAKIAFANLEDYLTVQPDGTAYVDLSALTRDQAAALQEVTVDDAGPDEDGKRRVKRVRVKLADKRAALVDVGKHLGMWKDKVELTGRDGGPIETAVVRVVKLPDNGR